MKKNECLSEETLEKVSAGYNINIPESIIIESNRPIESNENIIVSSSPAGSMGVSINLSDHSGNHKSQSPGLIDTQENASLKAGYHDLHAIPGNSLQNTSNPHKRRMP